MKSSVVPCCTVSEADTITGQVFNIQRFSLHDGPGIRSVVFLKGCQMKCAWCANPEGIDRGNINELNGEKTQRTVAEVHRAVMADEMYYRISGGGITLSGGEMALQPHFSRALLLACRQEGLHTAVETAGFVPWAALAEACEFSHLILYDLKLADAERHIRYTGVSLNVVLHNLQRLLEGTTPVRIRIPVIPQVNDSPDQAKKMMSLIDRLTRSTSCFAGVDLLPYHPFGTGKYMLLNQTYNYGEMHPHHNKANVALLEDAARKYHIPVNTLSHCIA